MSQSFIKRKEDFVCEHCGMAVSGSGFTNHCPTCLWSKHVDIFPGDRKEVCGGGMKPISIIQKHGNFIVEHECVLCGKRNINKLSAEDNFDAILSVLE